MILDPELNEKNIIQRTYPLPEMLRTFVEQEDWLALDQYFLKAELPGGALYEFLKQFLEFTSIEHIIAIRSAPEDEDGIWHDDGSRILGFSLSMTLNHEKTIGGHLLFKEKGTNEALSITTRPIGEILLFKTGIYGFEHMVSAVTEGKRVVIAGWCS
jgi:hypothetical protein